jgi:hypothetical protein
MIFKYLSITDKKRHAAYGFHLPPAGRVVVYLYASKATILA